MATHCDPVRELCDLLKILLSTITAFLGFPLGELGVLATLAPIFEFGPKPVKALGYKSAYDSLMMRALYQIQFEGRPYICVRQAESHSLAQHILDHPYWQKSVRPTLSAYFPIDEDLPPRDGIEESASTVYLPAGVPPATLITLQSIVDGWVMNKGDA